MSRMLTAVMTLMLCIVASLAAFISPNFWKSLAFTKHADSINGEWVGVVDIQSLGGDQLPLQENRGNSVMYLKIRPTLMTSLTTYTGTAELQDSSGTIGNFQVEDVSILQSGRISGFMRSPDGSGIMNGSLDGEFAPGMLTIKNGTRTTRDRMQGILRRGDKSSFKALCQQVMKALPEAK